MNKAETKINMVEQTAGKTGSLVLEITSFRLQSQKFIPPSVGGIGWLRPLLFKGERDAVVAKCSGP